MSSIPCDEQIQLSLFDTPPESVPIQSTLGATSPLYSNTGIRVVVIVLLILLFAKLRACTRSQELENNFTTLVLFKRIVRRFMSTAASITSQNTGRSDSQAAPWEKEGAWKSDEIPLDELMERYFI